MPKRRWIQASVLLAILFCAGGIVSFSTDWIDKAEHLPFWWKALVMVLVGGNVLLPVPSFVVMSFNAKAFIDQPPWVAFGISFAGSMLAWISCYWLGRLFGWTGSSGDDPTADAAELDAISRNIQRYGIGPLIVTRPVPMLAELTAAACGVAKMNFWRFTMGAALGVLPMAALYTGVGHYSDSWVTGAVAVLAPAILYTLIARPWRNRNHSTPK